MDGEEAGSEGEGAAEEQQKTESGEVNNVLTNNVRFHVLSSQMINPVLLCFY